MKVLIATPYFYPQIGGLENYARSIAKGLRAEDHEVVVVCGDKRVKTPTRETLEGFIVWRLPIWKVVSNTPVNPAWPFMLRKIIRSEKPNIINAHAPVVFMVDMITLVAGRTPVVVTYHAATLFKSDTRLVESITRLYQLAQRATFARAKAIIAVSDYVKQALGVRLASKTTVICNAVTQVAQSRQKAGNGLVFVNNLGPTHAWKGLDLILESLAIARNDYGLKPVLNIIGDGADRPRYEQKVDALGLTDTVRFSGQQVGTAKDKLIREAAALIMYPTTGNDAFPTVLLEGWAQGLAVISAAIGPIPSLIEDGKTGVLVEPNNPAALANGLRDLFNDPARIVTMGEAGRRLVEQEYTWPRQVGITSKLLESLV